MQRRHWFQNDQYIHEDPVPKEFLNYAGPHGIATVKAYPDGKTSKGWGADDFMGNYTAGKFNDQIAKVGWISGRWNFAFVMRALRLVCIDIDGKNDGLVHIGKLGMLPYTLAETSKSGDGFHLFYSVPDTWDPAKGFAMFRDRIGVEQGVDIRAVGCVYHHPGQRWNGRAIVELPKPIAHRWEVEAATGQAQKEQIIQAVNNGDPDELSFIRAELIDNLKKQIPVGRRNSTLFAIGAKMSLAGIEQWPALITQRAAKLGLDQAETQKIIANIGTYR